MKDKRLCYVAITLVSIVLLVLIWKDNSTKLIEIDLEYDSQKVAILETNSLRINGCEEIDKFDEFFIIYDEGRHLKGFYVNKAKSVYRNYYINILSIWKEMSDWRLDLVNKKIKVWEVPDNRLNVLVTALIIMIALSAIYVIHHEPK